MALISFPDLTQEVQDGVSIDGVINSSLWLEYPGQEVLESPYDATTQTVERSGGRWAGRLTLAETGIAEIHLRRRIEAFLASMRGSVNTTRLPISRQSGGTLVAGRGVTFDLAETRDDAADGVLIVGSATSWPVTEKLVLGDYVSVADRLHILKADSSRNSSGTHNLMLEPPPDRYAADEAVVAWENVTVLCRLVRVVEGWSGAPVGGDFSGPWNLFWKEIVD